MIKDQEILAINPREYDNKCLSQENILEWFDLCDAAWVHDGDPKKPHAELTSGMCSNGFFDCMRVLKYPNLTEILAQQLAKKLQLRLCLPEERLWVIGSPYAAITFSYEVAKALGAVHGFTEKDPADPKGKIMAWRRMALPVDTYVLQIEELITTSGTFQEVHRAVREGNSESVNLLPIIGALVHRPPKLPVYYNGSRKVIALIEREIWAVDPSICPLCKKGSARYRPKTHWAELTGKN